jgi:hypothetical protein
MLRLALIEKLSEAAARTVRRQRGTEEPTLDGEVAADSGREADGAAIGDTIANLRALGLMDWKEFVESTSVVERILRADPAGVYQRMTFDSRNYYRDVVAMLARGSRLTEEQVAHAAIQCARSSPEAARRHLGYHLLGEGRPALEERIGYPPPRMGASRRFIARRAAGFYFGGIVCVWLLATSVAAAVGWRMGALDTAGPGRRLVLLLLAAGGMGHFAVTLVDWLCSLAVAPRPMPRMDFAGGIPADCRTLVVVPTILTNEQGVSMLLHQLELRFLANRDENLLFALITDFPDADRRTLSDDSRLVSMACQGIERFNRQYNTKAFYLLHRPRTWNAQEGRWMGFERKRGKLSALNRLLRTGDASVFQATVGDLARLASVRYVITLDTDTRLPRDAGRELAGCMAHPLNRPRIDAKTRIVTGGHAVLQPRVTATLSDAQRSAFSRLLAGDAGIGPLAEDRATMLGTWAQRGTPADAKSIREGLSERAPELVLRTARGCDVDGEDRRGFAEARELAQASDLVLLCLGESTQMSGENASRSSIELPGVQEELALDVAAAGTPVVLLLSAGRPIAMERVEPKMNAILAIWQPGTRGALAIAEALLGRRSPSGRLAVTFPRTTGQIPIYHNMRPRARLGNQGAYQDIPTSPLYEFGHGLSYTSFDYGPIALSAPSVAPGKTLLAEVTVTNSGRRPAAETVFWFVHHPSASITQPIKELKHFEKAEIAAGASRTFRFTIETDRDLSFPDANGKPILDRGPIVLLAGPRRARFEVR